MSIDVSWLENELASSDKIKNIDAYITNLINSAKSKDAKTKISECFKSTTADISCKKSYEILDSLRHAFNSFVSGGLYDLYIYQSNESWYPKIILRQELKPNDIASLPKLIVIYRGCEISEHLDEKYGQSWSISKNVAAEFAYQHYSSQPWFNKNNRCILKAEIKKEDVYFSRQNHHENEIAVNTENLINVQKQ